MSQAYRCNGCGNYYSGTSTVSITVPNRLIEGPVDLCGDCAEDFKEAYSNDD